MGAGRAVSAALGTVLVAGSVALAGCGREKTVDRAPGGDGARPRVATGVRLEAVAAERLEVVRELAGSVQSAAVSQVSSRIMAQVVSVAVAEGDRVARGGVLAILDDRELQAKLRQAEAALRQAEAGRGQAAAQLELATATHGRYRALLDGQAISRQEYEQVATQETVARAALTQAEAAVTQAASAVEEARTWLAFAVLASPVSGRVLAKRIDPGSMAVPGQPLFAIEQEGRYRLEVPVDDSLSGTVAKGTPLAVSIDAAGYAGTVPVTEVVPAADPVSRTFIVRADLPAAAHPASGQYARVRLGLGSRTALVVPEGALVRRGQLDGVFVDDGGRLAFRIVQAGEAAGAARREILSGLAAGERIAVEGAARVGDGARLPGRAD